MTNKQIELVKRIAEELNIEVNIEKVMAYDTKKASMYIESLIAERNKRNAGHPTERQIEMVNDMRRCPFLSQAYSKELARVPERWYVEKQKLEDEYSACLKFLEAPFREEEYMHFSSMQEILDKMYEDDLLSIEMYEEVFKLPSFQVQEARILSLAEINDMKVRGNRVYKRIAFAKEDVKKLEMQRVKLADRISKANEIISEMSNHFDLKKIDRETVANWIEEHRPEYIEWQNTRLTRSQFNFIKELQKRISTQNASQGTRTDGMHIEGSNKFSHRHECCELSDEAILCFSKDFAQKYIQQLEKEIYDKTLSSIPQEPIVETQIEAKRAGMYREKSDDLQDMIRHLYAVIGQDADEVENVSEEDVKDIIKFVYSLLGKITEFNKSTQSAIEQIVSICNKVYDEHAIYEIVGLA